MAYGYAARLVDGSGQLVAVNFFHEQWMGKSPAPAVVSSGDGTGEQRGRWEDAAGSGGVRTTLRKDRGRNQVSGYVSELAGDTAGRNVVVQCVYGVGEDNMEDPQWESEGSSGEEGRKRLPGQGTRWG